MDLRTCVNHRDMYCYALVNKRLDDWITMDLMDLSRLEPPKKENNKTPMKVMNGSRPSSPDREMVCFGVQYLLSLSGINFLASVFITQLHVFKFCLYGNSML